MHSGYSCSELSVKITRRLWSQTDLNWPTSRAKPKMRQMRCQERDIQGDTYSRGCANIYNPESKCLLKVCSLGNSFASSSYQPTHHLHYWLAVTLHKLFYFFDYQFSCLYSMINTVFLSTSQNQVRNNQLWECFTNDKVIKQWFNLILKSQGHIWLWGSSFFVGRGWHRTWMGEWVDRR